MKLSVVVTTLNNRERLIRCLDTINEQVPSSTECIVVNGPSSDGTTGAVRDRSDVDVLVEIAERNPNVARNAGIDVATGDVIAFLADTILAKGSWFDAIESAFSNNADVVSGPVSGRNEKPAMTETIAGTTVPYFDGNNVAFTRSVLDACDGFDEYLQIGGARDCADRIAKIGYSVTWLASMEAHRDLGTDGGESDPQWGRIYRAFSYRLLKNYGIRPSVFARLGRTAIRDGIDTGRAVIAGDAQPSRWFTNGTAVIKNTAVGSVDGLRARFRDRSKKRNPYGLSSRNDRVIQLYDRR